MNYGWLKAQPWWKKGPALIEDGNTVSHVYFRNGALVDTKGLSWAMQGTVPQVGAGSIAGASKTPPSAGPFSDSNYYSLGTGNDVLDFTGDFYCTVVYKLTTLSQCALFENGVFGASGEGYILYDIGDSTVFFDTNGPSSAITRNALSPGSTTGVVQVLSGGRTGSGANQLAKFNLQTVNSMATPQTTAGTNTQARIGRTSSVANQYVRGVIYEVLWTSTAASDAAFVSQATAVKAKYGITAW